MKSIIILLATAVSFSAFAIEFITDEEVRTALSADKVIEVSRYSVQEINNNGCPSYFLESRSGRTYIVKKGDQSFLYATSSGLKDLVECREF